jgi:hypothetical protein
MRIKTRKIDGCRRLYPDYPAKQNWYARSRAARYARYLASLSC